METFLTREEWASAQGKKVLRRRCGSDDRGAAGLRQIEPSRGEVRPRAEQHRGEDVANIGCTMQEVGLIQRRERNSVREKTDIVCRNSAATATEPFSTTRCAERSTSRSSCAPKRSPSTAQIDRPDQAAADETVRPRGEGSPAVRIGRKDR